MVRFSTVSLPAFILLIILAVGFWWWSTRYLRKSVTRPVALIIKFVRALVLLFIVLLLVNFQLTWTSKKTVSPTVKIYLDNSASLNRFRASLTDSARVISTKLKQAGLHYQFRTFSEKIHEVGSANQLENNGTLTDLSAPLEDIQKNRRHQNIQAAVVISDGIHNSGVAPADLAETLNTPVYTMFIGDSSITPDLRIDRFDLPGIVYAGDTVSVTIQAGIRRLSNDTTLALSLIQDGKQIVTQEVSLQSGTYQREFSLQFQLDETGEHHITAVIDSLSHERQIGNNYNRRMVNVRPGRYRVLLISDEPSVETRFIVKALNQMDRFKLRSYFASLNNREPLSADSTTPDILFFIGKVPQQLATSLSNGNSIPVIYQVSASGESAVLSSAVKNWNEEKVSFTSSAENPLQSLLQIPAVWTRLSPVWVAETKSGQMESTGSILLRGAESGNPVLLIEQSEKLRRVIILARDLWRWDFIPPALRDVTEKGIYDKMLEQLFYWLLQDTNLNRLQVTIQRQQGESIGLRAEAQVYNNAYQPAHIARVWGEVLDSASMVVYRGMFQSQNNLYHLNLPLQKPGAYRLRTIAYTPNDTLNTVSDPLKIEPTNIEQMNRTGNPQLLQSISQLTGGSLLSSTRDFPVNRFQDRPKAYSRTDHQFILRKSFWIWAIIVIFLTADWWIRRRYGLL